MRNSIVRLGQGLLRQTPIAAPARSFGSVSAPALSSRGRTYVKQQQQPARTGLKDLHPLPESMREQLESDGAPQEPYTASGNSNDPAVHSSRRQHSQPEWTSIRALQHLAWSTARLATEAMDPAHRRRRLRHPLATCPRSGAPALQASASARSARKRSTCSWAQSTSRISRSSLVSARLIAAAETASRFADAIFLPLLPHRSINGWLRMTDGLIYLPEIKYRRILNRRSDQAAGAWLRAARPTWDKAS